MAIEPLHKALVMPEFEEIVRHVQYDSIRITVSKEAFDAGLRRLAGRDKHLCAPIRRKMVEALFQANPVDCSKDRYDVALTNGQYKGLLEYLLYGNFYYQDQVNTDDAEYALAFSFGERPTVNSQIRRSLEKTFGTKSNPPPIYAQWEIADVPPLGPGAHLTFHRIGLDPGKDYITTKEVIRKFKRMTKCDVDTKVFLACQAWHAPRCWCYCQKQQLEVVGGVFVDLFSPNDPQLWVRDELSWVIKESRGWKKRDC